jgi:hypothetical protein
MRKLLLASAPRRGLWLIGSYAIIGVSQTTLHRSLEHASAEARLHLFFRRLWKSWVIRLFGRMQLAARGNPLFANVVLLLTPFAPVPWGPSGGPNSGVFLTPPGTSKNSP